MADIRDINNMSDEEIGQLAYIVRSPAWENFFDPMLRGIVENICALLLDPSQERKDKRPDDFLRGQAVLVRNFLELPHTVIEEARMREQQQQRDADAATDLHDRSSSGMMPLGFREPDPTEY